MPGCGKLWGHRQVAASPVLWSAAAARRGRPVYPDLTAKTPECSGPLTFAATRHVCLCRVEPALTLEEQLLRLGAGVGIINL